MRLSIRCESRGPRPADVQLSSLAADARHRMERGPTTQRWAGLGAESDLALMTCCNAQTIRFHMLISLALSSQTKVCSLCSPAISQS